MCTIISAAKIAAEIHQTTFLLPDDHPKKTNSAYAISVDKLINIVIDKLVTIHGNGFSLEGFNEIKNTWMYSASYFHRENKIAKISYIADQNFCMNRFMITKELMHLYTGLSETGIGTSIVKLAQEARYILAHDITKELNAELFCFFLAIEVMIPYKSRENLFKMQDNNRSFFEMAHEFRIPVFVLNEFLTKEKSLDAYPGYCASSHMAYKFLGIERV